MDTPFYILAGKRVIENFIEDEIVIFFFKKVSVFLKYIAITMCLCGFQKLNKVLYKSLFPDFRLKFFLVKSNQFFHHHIHFCIGQCAIEKLEGKTQS